MTDLPFPPRTEEQTATTKAAWDKARRATEAAYATMATTTLAEYAAKAPTDSSSQDYVEAWDDTEFELETEYGYKVIGWVTPVGDLFEVWGYSETQDDEVFLGTYPGDCEVVYE